MFLCGEIKSWHILKMPRPRKTPGQLANKNSVRSRKFSVVIHDVLVDSKSKLAAAVDALTPDWSLIAEEPYNHQEGSHIHLFLKYDQPKSKHSVLTFVQRLALGGRVQVDIGRGDFDQCKKYITDPAKEKSLDNNITENVRKLSLMERYPSDIRKCVSCGEKYYEPPPDDFFGTPVICGYCSKCLKKHLSRLWNKGPPLPLEPPE